MHCYCVLRIAFCVLCMYCVLQIRNCLLCIAYCDIVSWSECERKWECIGLASAWYSYSGILVLLFLFWYSYSGILILLFLFWYSYQTLLLRNRPTQLLDWLCCFAPLWKQLTFPFSKCFFPGLMDSGSLQ